MCGFSAYLLRLQRTDTDFCRQTFIGQCSTSGFFKNKFLARDSILHMVSALYAIAVPSVRPSVRLSDGCIIEQESCAIAKMTARCALHISRSWAVAEICISALEVFFTRMRYINLHLTLTLTYGHSKLTKMAAAAILNLFESEIAPLDLPSPKIPP